MVANIPMGLLRTWNVANVMEKLKFLFYVILIDFNLTCHMWLMAIILYSAPKDNIVL